MPAWYVSPANTGAPSASCFHWFVGTMPLTSPGRSMPVGAPKPYSYAHSPSRSMPSLPASWKKNVSLEWPKPQKMLQAPQPARFHS